jgi:hypothetical protein
MLIEFVTGNGSEQNPYYFPSEANFIWQAQTEEVTEALNYLMYMIRNEEAISGTKREIGESIYFRTFNSLFKTEAQEEREFSDVTEVIPENVKRDDRVEALFAAIRRELLSNRPRL